MSEIPKIKSSLNTSLSSSSISINAPISNEYYEKVNQINKTIETNVQVENLYVNPLNTQTDLQTIYKSDFSQLDLKVVNYNQQKQKELDEYNQMLISIEKEMKELETNITDINETKNNYDIYKQDCESRIFEIVTNYFTFCSDAKLAELGITSSDLASMDYEELLKICQEKDSSVLEINQNIKQYQTDYLDKKIEALTGYKTYEEYKKYLNTLKSDQSVLLSAIQLTEEDMNTIRYRFLLEEEDYQNYSYEMVKIGTQAFVEASPLEKVRASGALSYTLEDENDEKLTNLIKAGEINPDLTKMYNYIYEKEGIDSANEYLSKMESTVNQICGFENAQKFLDSLKDEENAVDTLNNHLKTTGKGLITGIETFSQGITSWFTNSDVYTINDYETMYILQELQTNKNYNGFLDNNFEISESIGNMLPSIALSMLLTPTAGTVSMGVSAGGNSYHGALAEGYSTEKAAVYGVINGVSEATLEKYLGAIPGLSDVSVTGLKTFAQAMAREGIEEGTQEYLDAFVRSGLFKEDFDLEEVSKNAEKSAIYGAITGGIMNTPSLAINGINNHIANNQNRNENIEILNVEDEISYRNDSQNRLKSEIEKFNLENFYTGKMDNDGGILLITPEQSIMTTCYAGTGQHAQTVEEIYKVIYNDSQFDIENRAEDIWQNKVLNDGNIVVQLVSDDSSIVWVPDKISKSQYEALKNFYNQVAKVSNNTGLNPEFWPALTGLDLPEGNINALRTTLIEAEKRISDVPIKNENNADINLSNNQNNETIEALEVENIEKENHNETIFNIDITEKIENEQITEKVKPIEVLDVDNTNLEITEKMPKYEPTEKIIDTIIDENAPTEKIPPLSEIYKGSIFNADGSINYQSENQIISDRLDSFFSAYGNSYGTDQGALSTLFNYQLAEGSYLSGRNVRNIPVANIISKLGNTKYFELKNKLLNLGYSKRDASIILSGVDNTGACSYAAVANEIFATFYGKSELFENYFGFPMYYTNDFGKLSLNTEELLLDMYLYENDVSHGGKLFRDGKVVSFHEFYGDAFDRPILNSSSQVSMSAVNGKKVDAINAYLNTKGLDYSSSTRVFDGSFGGFSVKTKKINKKYLKDSEIDSLRVSVKSSLDGGSNQVSMGITSLGNEIRMIPLDLKGAYCTTGTWGEGVSHAVFVTSVTNDGFIVSSWGSRYLIPFVDLQNGGKFSISNSVILDLNTKKEVGH